MTTSHFDSLPPMFDGIKDGEVVWKRLGELDHEMLGYFLSCHLLIEHYMDEFLKARHPELNWEKSRLTFGQRVNMLSWKVLVRDEKFDPIPAIKHLNTLRNKISHRLEIKIDLETLLPLAEYMKKISGSRYEPYTDPRELLSVFMSTCCATFAGNLSAIYSHHRA